MLSSWAVNRGVAGSSPARGVIEADASMRSVRIGSHILEMPARTVIGVKYMYK